MKLLTDELLNEKFIELHGLDPENLQVATQALDVLKDYYNFDIVETYDSNANFYIYEESTADGYSVYVATCNLNSICVTDDIYYYSSDLSKLVEEVLYAGDTLAVDQSEDYFEAAIEEMWCQFVDEQFDELKTELLSQGYVEKIAHPFSTIGLLDMIHQRMIITESDEYLYCVPTQTPETSGDDLRIISFYKQLCNDPQSFRKYARKVLNCQLFFTGEDTIKLTLIPLT